MEDTKYITVNNIDYIITDELNFNNALYMLGIDQAGNDTLVVLKQIIINGEEYVQSVQDDDEFEMILELVKGLNN